MEHRFPKQTCNLAGEERRPTKTITVGSREGLPARDPNSWLGDERGEPSLLIPGSAWDASVGRRRVRGAQQDKNHMRKMILRE